MSSQGFEDRKETFACLVNYLDQRNVTDECFGVVQSIDVSKVDCAKIVEEKRQSFYDDLQTRLQRCSPLYGVTSGECEVLNNINCTFENVKERTVESCQNTDLADKFEGKNSGPDNPPGTFEGLKENCRKLSNCLNCMIVKLNKTNYEEIRFHSAAVNLTVIEYKVWEYFLISPRMNELISQGKEWENKAKSLCKKERKCLDNAVYL